MKYNGRAAVIIPDGFLFGSDAPKLELKKRLLNQFNLHTVIRLPASVFAPYTSITTNILFFNNDTKSKGVWFFRVDMPHDFKHFSKTKPMRIEHFADCLEWWDNRRDIKDADTDTFKAKFFSVDELVDRNYDFDLCGYPTDSESVLTPLETIHEYHKRRADLTQKFDARLEKIIALLEGK